MPNTKKNVLEETLAVLEKGDRAEAKKLLEDFFKENKKPEGKEPGEIYVNAVTTYLAIQNEITEAEIEDLKNTVQSIQEIEKAEKEIDHEIKIAETRAKLKE